MSVATDNRHIETLAELGWSPSPMDPESEGCNWVWTLKLAKLESDRKRQRDLRDSKAVKIREATYQRSYAATEAGKERRRAASRAYKRRKRAATAKASPDSTGTAVQRQNAQGEAL